MKEKVFSLVCFLINEINFVVLVCLIVLHSIEMLFYARSYVSYFLHSLQLVSTEKYSQIILFHI